MKDLQEVSIKNQVYIFLKAYLNFESPTFGNAYKSGREAGYSHYYCRVIRRHFPRRRIRSLQKALNDPVIAGLIAGSYQSNRSMETEMNIEQLISAIEKVLVGKNV